MRRTMVRAAQGDEDRAILAINEECEAMLSPLTLDLLRRMLSIAYRVRVSDELDAMLIAFDERAPYWSPNFAWFRERYARFVYVDRVAVTGTARGRGIARALYEDLMSAARADGHTLLCAEIYSDPPNPVSDAFHASMGFVEVGSAYLADRDKTVRLLVRHL
jgi:uncharacterized protein